MVQWRNHKACFACAWINCNWAMDQCFLLLCCRIWKVALQDTGHDFPNYSKALSPLLGSLLLSLLMTRS